MISSLSPSYYFIFKILLLELILMKELEFRLLFKKWDILKTFEIFNSEAIGVIRERIVKFVLIEAENFFAGKSSISTSIKSDESAQITVVNNQKLYNLLDSTWRKRQQKLKDENIKC
jgi:hypothetical protein